MADGHKYNNALTEFVWSFNLASSCHPCVGKNLTNGANLAQHQAKWCTVANDSEDNCNLGKIWNIIPAKKISEEKKSLINIFPQKKHGIYKTSRKALRKMCNTHLICKLGWVLTSVSTIDFTQLFCWTKWVHCEGALGSQLLKTALDGPANEQADHRTSRTRVGISEVASVNSVVSCWLLKCQKPPWTSPHCCHPCLI